MFWILLALLAVAALAAFVLGDAGTLGGLDAAQIAALVSGVVLLVLVASGYFSGRRREVWKGAKDLLIWVVLMLLLVLAYSFRTELHHMYQRIAGELLPPGHSLSISDAKSGRQAVRIRRRRGGHFRAKATINGQTVAILVDTGATQIVMSQSDARSVGIDVERLHYNLPSQTANGIAYSAATTVGSVAVGPIIMYNVRVHVAKPGALSESLLGMTFLTRLSSYEVSGDFLTLRQ